MDFNIRNETTRCSLRGKVQPVSCCHQQTNMLREDSCNLFEQQRALYINQKKVSLTAYSSIPRSRLEGWCYSCEEVIVCAFFFFKRPYLDIHISSENHFQLESGVRFILLLLTIFVRVTGKTNPVTLWSQTFRKYERYSKFSFCDTPTIGYLSGESETAVRGEEQNMTKSCNIIPTGFWGW